MNEKDVPMIGPARRWLERRRLAASREPVVRVDACWLEPEKDRWVVVIEGFGLRPAATPPFITVGNVVLEGLSFEEGGRQVTGVLGQRPEDEHVVVDLGYARAEGTARGR